MTEEQQSRPVQWGGRLWVLAVVALVLTMVILLVLFPRSFAYQTPPPTPIPWTEAPGLYVIPTRAPSPAPTIAPAQPSPSP